MGETRPRGRAAREFGTATLPGVRRAAGRRAAAAGMTGLKKVLDIGTVVCSIGNVRRILVLHAPTL